MTKEVMNTAKAKAEKRRERFIADCEDSEIALELLRRVRDDESADNADRLEAVRLIEKLKKG